MEYLINLGLAGLKRVLKNRKFTESEYTNKEFEEYKKEIDPVSEYLETLSKEMIINEIVKDIYLEYIEYCNREGYEQINNVSFSKKVNSKFNLTSKLRKINGIATRVYVDKGNS